MYCKGPLDMSRSGGGFVRSDDWRRDVRQPSCGLTIEVAYPELLHGSGIGPEIRECLAVRRQPKRLHRGRLREEGFSRDERRRRRPCGRRLRLFDTDPPARFLGPSEALLPGADPGAYRAPTLVPPSEPSTTLNEASLRAEAPRSMSPTSSAAWPVGPRG